MGRLHHYKLNIFFGSWKHNPGPLSLTDVSRQNHHVAGEARSNNNTTNNGIPLQPAPEPRPPTFERYPPSAPREWTSDADGQHLRSLWQSLTDACEGQPFVSRPGFLPFVTAVTRILQHKSTAGNRGDGGSGARERGRPAGQDSPEGEGGASLEANAPAEAVSFALPEGVIRGMAEAVLSASVCRCGNGMVGGGTHGSSSSSSPGAIGCPTHGFSAVSWVRILPSGNWRDGAGAVSEGGGLGRVSSTRVGGDDTSGSNGGDTEQTRTGVNDDGVGCHRNSAGGAGLSHRRACLVATLQALATACRWRHTREELAMLCRGGGGGIAKALALLCNTLCARMTELRRRQQGPFRRSHVAGSAEADR